MKVSDLFISNPIASIQDTDLMYLSVDDGGGGYDSGACTFLSLKNNIPTLYTADGTLLADRTIDMDGNIALWEGGQVAIGAPGTAFDDVLAMLQVFPNGERPAFAIGSFAGVQAQAGVLALANGDFIGGYLESADITDGSNLRLLLGVDSATGEYVLNFYGPNGTGDPRILMQSANTGSRLKLYDDSSQSFLEFFANGNITLGGGVGDIIISGQEVIICDVSDDLSFFNGTPVPKQPGLTAIQHTAPGTPDYLIQDLTNSGGFGFVTKDEGNTVLSVLKACHDALKAYNLLT